MMTQLHGDYRVDLGCILERESVEARYPEGRESEFERVERDRTLIFFFLRMLRRLQGLGTVPAMDLEAYEACLKHQ
jgi:hypothetical protein